MNNYFIKDGYQPNPVPSYWDDTSYTDEFQDEVYARAASIAAERGRADSYTVVDYGCGSGYKLLKYFADYRTVGIDLAPTVAWLNAKYPSRLWLTNPIPLRCDLLIAADVIEHLPDPDRLLDFIADCAPHRAILSTPHRDLIPDLACQRGPTGSHHVREWNFEEFARYIGSRFRILEHYVANPAHCTQVVIVGMR